MENKSFKDVALKVAKWWSEKAFRTPLNQNNGDTSSQGGLVFMLQNRLSSLAQEKATDEKIEAFEQKLVELIEERHNAFPDGQIWLEVDYSPCETLAKAATHADLSLSCFPCKSSAIIDKDGKIKVKYQYGGSFIEL